jgi:hypothetical protein
MSRNLKWASLLSWFCIVMWRQKRTRPMASGSGFRKRRSGSCNDRTSYHQSWCISISTSGLRYAKCKMEVEIHHVDHERSYLPTNFWGLIVIGRAAGGCVLSSLRRCHELCQVLPETTSATDTRSREMESSARCSFGATLPPSPQPYNNRKPHHDYAFAGAQEAGDFVWFAREKLLFVRLVTLTTSGDVAITFRLSPGCEQCVRKDTDVTRCVVVAEGDVLWLSHIQFAHGRPNLKSLTFCVARLSRQHPGDCGRVFQGLYGSSMLRPCRACRPQKATATGRSVSL